MNANPVAEHSAGRTDVGRESAQDALRVACSIALILAFSFLFLWQTTAAFIEQWTSEHNETYTHGSLITAISFWLIFRNREKYAMERSEFSPLGLSALIVVGLIWLVSVRAGIRTVHELLLPLIAWLGVYAALGRRMAVACCFPFAFLYFQTIAWDVVSPLLQHITVVASDLLLSITSVVAFVEGNLIHLPSGTFEVAGGCSGLHFFIVATALAALYGELEEASFRTRIWLVVVAMALSMLSNWIRVYVIVVAGYLTNMQHYLVTVEHYWFGWAVFAITMAGYFVIARWLTRQEAGNVRSAIPSSDARRTDRRFLMVALAVAAIATPPLLNISSPIRPASIADASFTSTAAGWPGASSLSARPPSFHNADRIESVVVDSENTAVEFHVVTYLLQTQDKELANYKNSALRSSDEQVVSRGRSARWPATQLIVEEPEGSRSIVEVGYTVGRVKTDNPVLAQLYYGLRSLISPVVSRAVVLRAACDGADCAGAQTALDSIAMKFRLGSTRT